MPSWCRVAADGFAVIVNYVGDTAPAEALVPGVDKAGRRALSVKAGANSAEAVRRLFDSANTSF
jgi:3-oxoacyl-[acyl-carrier protein] reductase